MTLEEADLIITEQNKSTEEILKAVAKIKLDYHELCNLKDKRIADLEAQIEKTKCVQNCKHGYDGQYENTCHKNYQRNCNKDCKFCKDWELKEI